jgi:hypothetical protein
MAAKDEQDREGKRFTVRSSFVVRRIRFDANVKIKSEKEGKKMQINGLAREIDTYRLFTLRFCYAAHHFDESDGGSLTII